MMQNTDFRIETSLVTHPKTIKLIRRCGPEGFVSLISLWSFAAAGRPEGDFSGMDVEDIEIAAKWDGPEGQLVETLIKVGFLDGDLSTGLRLHDWAEHNPWASNAAERGDRSRLSHMAKTHPKIYKELKAQGIVKITKKEYVTLTTNQRAVNESLTTVNEPPTTDQRAVNGSLKIVNASLSPLPPPLPTPVVISSLSKVSPLDEELSQYFLSKIQEHSPKAKSNLKQWADIFRLMRTKDDRTEVEIRQVIDFAVSDDFWRCNILSPTSLRKKFDQLALKANRSPPDPVTQNKQQSVIRENNETLKWAQT